MDITKKCEEVYKKCLLDGNQYLQKAIFQLPQIIEFVDNFQEDREEFSINSRYMHRGFYCPSLDLEHIVTNMKRGKIAKRISLKSNLTNCYLFDNEGKLRVVETYYPNDSFDTEYIFYENNTVCGVTFDSDEHITAISVEEYLNDRLESYFWCACDSENNIFWMVYEIYHYDHRGFLETEFYDMTGSKNKRCSYLKYRFQLDAENKIQSGATETLEQQETIF